MVTVQGNLARFRFFRPAAKEACLVGDFNGWRNGELPMIPNDNGYWEAIVRLPEGSHRFRYLADGQWVTDYAACGVQAGPLGLDSVVRINPQFCSGNENNCRIIPVSRILLR